MKKDYSAFIILILIDGNRSLPFPAGGFERLLLMISTISCEKRTTV